MLQCKTQKNMDRKLKELLNPNDEDVSIICSVLLRGPFLIKCIYLPVAFVFICSPWWSNSRK